MRYYGNFKISQQIYFFRSYENREVLANLETDSDKNLPLPISEEMQPPQNTLDFFICYSTFLSPQVKQNYIIITANWMY